MAITHPSVLTIPKLLEGSLALGPNQAPPSAFKDNSNNGASAGMEEFYPLLELEIPRLRRYARFLCRNVDDADDLVQDCLIRAVGNLERWQPGTNLRAWLFVILRNVYINDRRRSNRSPVAAELECDYGDHGALGNQEARQEILQLQDAFNKLSVEHREILTLVTIEGFEYEEAAGILSIPIGTVRSRLARARAALKQLYDDSGDVQAARK